MSKLSYCQLKPKTKLLKLLRPHSSTSEGLEGLLSVHTIVHVYIIILRFHTMDGFIVFFFNYPISIIISSSQSHPPLKVHNFFSAMDLFLAIRALVFRVDHLCFFHFFFPISLVEMHEQEHRWLVADEPVEIEKQLVEVQDFRKMADRFGGIYILSSNLIKNKPSDVNMSPVGLGNNRILTDYAHQPPRTLQVKIMSTLIWKELV